MTQRSRRPRSWYNQGFLSTLAAAGAGGQQITNLSTIMEARLGVTGLPGYTVSRLHMCTLITSGTSETGVGRFSVFIGIGVYPSGMDAGDFPDLHLYEGDWMAFECFTFQLSGTELLPVLPESASFQRSDYRSMRKINRAQETLFLVAQIDSAPAAAVNIKGEVSGLMIMP